MLDSAKLVPVKSSILTGHPSSDAANGCMPTGALQEILRQISSEISPMWPLKDMVAVNPFHGMVDKDFLTVRSWQRNFRNIEMLMPLSYYQDAFQNKNFTAEDISLAINECAENRRIEMAELHLESLQAELLSGKSKGSLPTTIYNLADVASANSESDWRQRIVDQVSKYCLVHFDQGQASWKNPWRDMLLFSGWKQYAARNLSFEIQGVTGFRKQVAALPDSAVDATNVALKDLGISSSQAANYLRSLIYLVPGWASYLKYIDQQQAAATDRSTYQKNQNLIDLFAILITFEKSLVVGKVVSQEGLVSYRDQCDHVLDGQALISADASSRYVFQVAMEIAYRGQLLKLISGKRVQPGNPSSQVQTAVGIKGGIKGAGHETQEESVGVVADRRLAQMVFCIDVRSEVMRRHLEAVSRKIETFGFAGFFGIPLEYISLANQQGLAQCPALLQPSVSIREATDDMDGVVDRRVLIRSFRKLWKSFQVSASSSFSFIESFGLTYVFHLGKRLLGFGTRVGWARDGLGQGESIRPSLAKSQEAGLDVEQQVQVGESILRNIGLVKDFAKLVVFCGHESQTQNNPQKAGLDCGVCGGHSGEVNARVAAMILNSVHVRQGLKSKGIEIPEDTTFVAAVHDTTVDHIRFYADDWVGSEDGVTRCNETDLSELKKIANKARRLTVKERSRRLGPSVQPTDVDRRAIDWSEVRPEWGLSGNAALIVAPRSRTIDLPLDGRTFLHSYVHDRDPELATLELIMTAPMVVANWINMQYFASVVDNLNFGSGNKVLHDIAGAIGIFEGNGGDLRNGLAMQSVHDGKNFQHDPLRLLVIIEAPRRSIDWVIQKHEIVHNLTTRGWVQLVCIDQESYWRLDHAGIWNAC